MAADNKSLGRFILSGIPPAPRGVPKIEVTFDIDANGILNVTARDQATGREQKITITASSGLNEQEIQRMVREAESHAEEDRKRREAIDLRNQAEAMIYQAERTLADYGDKIPSDVKTEVEEKIAAMRDVLNREPDNVDLIRRTYDDMTAAVSKVGTSMYEQAGAGAGAGAGAAGAEGQPGGGQAGPEEATVEGEFREVHNED
jgi:molecular chaperone DnaK